MCVTASSPCIGESSTRCSTAATVPTGRSPSARAWSATSWATTIRTATPRSTTRWSGSASGGPCATRWSRGRATSAPAATTSRPHARYTECKMAPLAMEMVRDIDEDTVDFSPNYDNRGAEPDVLPARFPNLLVNGSGGIAVGMATNIPPHNLREVASGVQWYLEHPDAGSDELLDVLLERIKGPDFPTSGLVVGTTGIEQAYRTGRGSVTMRAVVEVEERQAEAAPAWSSPNCPTRSTPTLSSARSPNWPTPAGCRASPTSRMTPRPEPACASSSCSSATPSPPSSATTSTSTPSCRTRSAQHGRVGRRRAADPAARRVRPPLGHPPDRGHRPPHASTGCAKAEERAHIVRGYLKAIDAIDEVIALIRASATVDDARSRADGLPRSRRACRPTRSWRCSFAA